MYPKKCLKHNTKAFKMYHKKPDNVPKENPKRGGNYANGPLVLPLTLPWILLLFWSKNLIFALKVLYKSFAL